MEVLENFKKATEHIRVHKESVLKLHTINTPTIQEQLSNAAAN